MPALFPPVLNAVYRAVLIAMFVAINAVIWLPMIWIRTDYASNAKVEVEQPMEFDHRHHVRDDGIPCVYCHDTVETEAFAGMPSTERCMGCHGQIWPASPELAPLRTGWQLHEPVRWKRINAMPDYVYFHHGVHVQAGVACEFCHGPVEDMPRVYRQRNLSMLFCMSCHRNAQDGRQISHLTQCTTCHR